MKIETYKKIAIFETSPIRQIVIAPSWDCSGDRLILACVKPQDMSLETEEEIRLNYEKFPAIGILTKDGKVKVDPYFSLGEGLYNDINQLREDLSILMRANGF